MKMNKNDINDDDIIKWKLGQLIRKLDKSQSQLEKREDDEFNTIMNLRMLRNKSNQNVGHQEKRLLQIKDVGLFATPIIICTVVDCRQEHAYRDKICISLVEIQFAKEIAYEGMSQSDRGASLNYIYDPLTDV